MSSRSPRHPPRRPGRIHYYAGWTSSGAAGGASAVLPSAATGAVLEDSSVAGTLDSSATVSTSTTLEDSSAPGTTAGDSTISTSGTLAGGWLSASLPWRFL